MDELILGLLGVVIEGAAENLSARSRGCFLFFASILFCFWFLLGSLIGYAIFQSFPLALLVGGTAGTALAVGYIRALARRAQKLRSELQ